MVLALRDLNLRPDGEHSQPSVLPARGEDKVDPEAQRTRADVMFRGLLGARWCKYHIKNLQGQELCAKGCSHQRERAPAAPERGPHRSLRSEIWRLETEAADERRCCRGYSERDTMSISRIQ